MEKMKKALDTDQDILLVAGSASVFLEGAIRNGVGRKSLGMTNGSFGLRSIEIARLNGKEVGIHWRPGQEFEITGTAQPGGNTLEVDVTNTLINRVSGLEAFPDIAPELQPRYGTALHPPAGRALGLIGFEPLPPSGLLGPVRIIPCKEMEIPWVQE